MSGKPTILVVDDDAPILLLMRNVLREFGFDSSTAASGEDALAAARGSRPSLILVDRNMPGMSGEQLIEALRQEGSLHGVPILILSGEPVTQQDLKRIQADGAVLKPFDLRALIDQIHSHLDATAGAERPRDRADR